MLNSVQRHRMHSAREQCNEGTNVVCHRDTCVRSQLTLEINRTLFARAANSFEVVLVSLRISVNNC